MTTIGDTVDFQIGALTYKHPFSISLGAAKFFSTTQNRFSQAILDIVPWTNK